MNNGEDFQIELGQASRRHIENKKSPLRDGGFTAAPYDQPDTGPLAVFISDSSMRAIERHVSSAKDREVGGILLGGFYRDDQGSFLEVTEIIEARHTEGSDVSLTFTHETWEQINAEQANRGADTQIVGWVP